MSKIIEIKKLFYQDIINDISLTIEENKFITISGSNNSGKTTLMRIINRNIKEKFENIKIANKPISSYKITDYTKIIQTIFPKEILFFTKNLENELSYLVDNTKENNDLITLLINNLKIKKILTKETTLLTKKEIILYQIFISLLNKPKILIIEDINNYFDKNEIKKLFDFFEIYREKYGLTLIITTLDLNLSLYTDYIYILDKGSIILEGAPLEVIQKDNILNKIGLNLPFMIDLSVKLRDYELVNEIELNLDRMIEKLWK